MNDLEERTIFGTPPLERESLRDYTRDFQRSLGEPMPGDPPLADPWAGFTLQLSQAITTYEHNVTLMIKAVDNATPALKRLAEAIHRAFGLPAPRARRTGHRHRGTHAWARRYAHK
jgi:hypothetical protein